MLAKTKTGFQCEIDDNATDDWETLELLAKADDGNISALIGAIVRILGEDGYSKLKEHVRSLSSNGKVSTVKMRAEFTALMESAAPTKN